MAVGVNPTKEERTGKLIPRLQKMLNGYRKEDSPTLKKLPVEVDVPELMVRRSRKAEASALQAAVALHGKTWLGICRGFPLQVPCQHNSQIWAGSWSSALPTPCQNRPPPLLASRHFPSIPCHWSPPLHTPPHH